MHMGFAILVMINDYRRKSSLPHATFYVSNHPMEMLEDKLNLYVCIITYQCRSSNY
jgi:hypothetical protein